MVSSAMLLLAPVVRAEVILQYFNTSWRELTYKLPELAEVGYGSIWLPPPTKGSGGLSVGYDCWDPFDLGGVDQRGSVKTRYGTEAEFLRLVRTAHRFGIRVYVDNIMNHRAFDVPGYNADTPIDTYPGMVPEDFHLRVTEEGFYRKWDNVANWGDSWQVQYRNFSDLIDIAQETPDNGNFGTNEGDHIPKIRIVRHPQNPEYYDYHPTLDWVGFASPEITTEVIAANPDYYEEDVNAYLIRAARWLVHHTRIDGLRLDAVKHVPAYFFGEQWAPDKDSSDAGYCGNAQWQFNMTRGFDDWDNHRDTVFSTDTTFGRNDLMMFGEHLGEPPSFGDYIAAGMRLVDSRLHSFLNGNLGKPWGSLYGLEHSGSHGFSAGTGVPYVKSHDDDYASCPELQFALNLTRQGLPNVYTDGNYQSETLGESGGAFPRHANTAFLGQFADGRIPNMVYIHNHFARGDQVARWGDGDVVAYERRDKRENLSMDDADGTVLFFAMNDNYAAGQYREIETSFRPGDYLWQYSSAGGGFYYSVSWDRKIKVIVPPGGYFAFSWRNPEPSDLWSDDPVTIYEDGVPAGRLACERKDGPDGDPGFNPYDVPDPDPTDFTYEHFIPRVTSPTNLRFVARVDGSAANVLMKLDGGIDLNGITHASGDPRDHPPGNEGSTEVFEGYEQTFFVQRQFREKFAARDIDLHNVIGSDGAETYQATVGSAGFTINTGATGRDSDEDTADWAEHDPADTNDFGSLQFDPPPQDAADAGITIRVQIGYQFDVNRAVLYYTTDGETWPEGAGGEGIGNTRTLELAWDHIDPEPGGTTDWWNGTLPPFGSGTVLRYKIGVFLQQGEGTWEVVWPGSGYAVDRKKSMMGVWEIDNFDPSAVSYRPHIDFGETAVGLEEGFHVLRARAFLNRTGKSSIYNTFVQPFYYDAATPTGEIVHPGSGETLYQNEYGVVVRCDPTVVDVWYHIDDDSAANDDAQTGQEHGNGTNELGEAAWVRATQITPTLSVESDYPDEWRFGYRNIPDTGDATISVRLLELSSVTNMTLSDAKGHFTTIERTVPTRGPAYTMFIAFPTYDGEQVWEGYDLKVRFSKTLRNTDDGTLLSRFLIRLDDSVQGREDYRFNWDVDEYHHEIAYTLPDLYDGDPSGLHHIYVTHTNAAGGGVTLTSERYVKARETDGGPHVDIIAPPELDSDGKAYEIVLPDVPDPEPEDRQFTIRVETDLSARGVWIEFTNSVGTAEPFSHGTNALGGTMTVTQGTNTVVGLPAALSGSVAVTNGEVLVTGTGTAFADELALGNTIQITTNLLVVTQIVSQTAMLVNVPWPDATATGLPASSLPAFDSEVSVGGQLLIDDNLVTVAGIQSSSNLTLTADYPGANAAGLKAYRISDTPEQSGNRLYWDFLWSGMEPGLFHFYAMVDTNNNISTVEGRAFRNTTVILREMTEPDDDDLDDDDDGLLDTDESISVELPETNPETWVNGEVHTWLVYGHTDPLLPDTDGDGLPDALESGWREASHVDTDTAADTNGDGWPNFLGDYDPPFFNTVPDNNGMPEYVFNDLRTRQIHGTMTDPQLADTDGDGLPDGVEDANRDGWVNGDGIALPPGDNWWDVRTAEDDWPDGEMDPWETWTETDPRNTDTDLDGASDGDGEDTDGDGYIGGDLNSNRVYEAGEMWEETDPLNPDTDGDGLPDGWEKRYDFDALNDGIPGHTNMGSALELTIDDVEHGADGNPDGDTIVVGGVTNDYVNYMEFQNGTHPRRFDSGDPPPEGSITIGRGPELGVIYERTYYEEFMDWSRDHCLVLDEYEGDGGNNQSGDVYKGWDGWDESRDIVAFYAHDGGDVGQGGDGMFYFRVDLHDLKPYAEEKNLDIYVVIDTGNPDTGEMNLPDEVDTITWNRWEAVVAVYASSQGRVYIDTDTENNTTTWGQDLSSYGVVGRDQNAEDGFIDAYFNAELDAVEFSISRQALIDAGWSGAGASNFNYQVFTTRDGTGNSPPGNGDIGGRSDVRDAIFNDYIAEDYWQSQQGFESIMKFSIPGTSRATRTKVAMLLHANQAIQPGAIVQPLINTGSGAGYHRPFDGHALFRQPVTLHITPTLASAIQWASSDTPWLDGPSFNARIAGLIGSNVVYLAGSSFADNPLPYFTPAFNRDNEQLARSFLETIYETSISTSRAVFWMPERVADSDVFGKILDMGYGTTVVDQDTHMFNWFGRQESLKDSGYRINRIAGVDCFVINNVATSYRFDNHDNGVDMPWRALFNRKARSGVQDQVVTVFSMLEDFTDNADADAYDLNVRWVANRPWVSMVALETVAAGEDDSWGDAQPDVWGRVDRGSPAQLDEKQAHSWLNHATQEDYDSWYKGSDIEESLDSMRFEIRPGTAVPQHYGMVYTNGMVADAWAEVSQLINVDVQTLARAALHTSVFETGFHDEDNHDLSRFSTGDYIYPATSSNALAFFARAAQAQTRVALIYGAVDDWTAAADGLAAAVSGELDVDGDGETECLLYNRTLFALIERIGGRMIGAWLRDPDSGRVFQVIGNQAGYAGSDTEEEGETNVTGTSDDWAIGAYRTSGLKDWWDVDADSSYVNDLYTVNDHTGAWRLVSSDVRIAKTVTLDALEPNLEVAYTCPGTLYVRHGLSPDLGSLLTSGQARLSDPVVGDGRISLLHEGGAQTITATIGYADDGHTAALNPDATDEDTDVVDFATINMRNQAHTHQVEIYGSGSFTFSMTFSLEITAVPDTHYVDSGSTDPVAPYTNWNTAAVTIQEALDEAADGDEVLVTDGSYDSGSLLHPGVPVPSRIVITNDVLVQSVNGAAVTFVRGEAGVRGALLTSGCLQGFTICDAEHDARGGGVYLLGAILEDCVVSNNTAHIAGGGVYAGDPWLSEPLGTILRCVVWGNQLDTWEVPGTEVDRGAGVYGGTCVGSLVARNSGWVDTGKGTRGAGCFGSTLENCTIADNGPAHHHPGASTGPATNCISYGNLSYTMTNSPYDTVSYSCSWPDDWYNHGNGSGNMTGNPQFANPGNGDYRLSTNSPCINAGTNLPGRAGSTDMDGNPRVRDGRVDMGCYEQQPGPESLPGPDWWYSRDVIVLDVPVTNDYAAALSGQLKWISTKAADAFANSLLWTGAGAEEAAITNLVNEFAETDNYQPINLGQLKHAAALFYDWLIAKGATNAYPWADAPNTNDFAAGNVGQLKQTFSFEVPQ